MSNKISLLCIEKINISILLLYSGSFCLVKLKYYSSFNKSLSNTKNMQRYTYNQSYLKIRFLWYQIYKLHTILNRNEYAIWMQEGVYVSVWNIACFGRSRQIGL